MDYAYFPALRDTSIKMLNVSYDIACQWHKGLALQLEYQQMAINFLVPKFHLPAHIAQCHWEFSFNWIPGVMKWAPDTGPLLLRKIQEAVPECNKHRDDFNELTESLQLKYLALLERWKHEVEEWEADRTKPNLFEIWDKSFTQASVRLQLAHNKAKAALSQAFLLVQELTWKTNTKLGQHATDTHKTKIQQQRNGLLHCIKAWAKIQMLFMPGVVALREVSTDSSSETASMAEDFICHLPSQIACQVMCPIELETLEWKLQEGQAHNALNELQQALRSQSYMLKFKDCFLHGQGTNTCARNCLKSVDNKINASTAKYRGAHVALLALGPLLGMVSWTNKFQALGDSDICGMSVESDESLTEGRHRLSWIWIACGHTDGNSDDDSDESLQDG
ncbi:hypothetical protein BDN67DRAFT_983564 [Paxillus ammoniavirescens]|nr:hypothetical protein BDN67DRAFT_983564 [Paxillus ammoniavirescens]